jgi:hypothetical protein
VKVRALPGTRGSKTIRMTLTGPDLSTRRETERVDVIGADPRAGGVAG